MRRGLSETVAVQEKRLLFKIEGSEVYIKRIGNVIVLIPQENPWQALFDSLNLFSEDFMESREQPSLEIREELP